MSRRSCVCGLLGASLVLGALLFTIPSVSAKGTVLQWTLTGTGLANGTFQNTTVYNQAVQLSSRLPPTNRTMVLDVGSYGSADSLAAALPSVLREPDGSYKMWYTGFDGSRDRILLAVSPDGINWTKKGVVMDVSNGAIAPDVLRIGATYHMWFTDITWGGSPIGYLDEIYHATSANGVSWTIQGRALPVGASGSWDGATVTEPSVVQDASGLYRMYYAGYQETANVQIGVATSLDLVSWTRWSSNPVVPWGPAASWDSGAVAEPNVVPGATWTMYYGARQNATADQIGLASSTDGFKWTKDPANPVIRPEVSPYWDDFALGSPNRLTDPSGTRLYFAGSDGSRTRIGEYSFSPPPAMSYAGTYQSPIFDSGAAGTMWLSLASSATVPIGTSLSFRARAGNASNVEGSWTAWTPADSLPSLLRDRYLQVGVDFESTRWNLTPAVTSVTVSYMTNAAPETVPKAPGGGAWTNVAQPILRWNATDPDGDAIVSARVEVSATPDFSTIALDSGNLTLAATSWPIPDALADGTWYWRVQTEDVYAAWGTWTTSVFRLDTVPPSVSISNPSPGALLHASSLDVVWTAADALSGVDHLEVSVDGAAAESVHAGNSSFLLNSLADGSHTIRVTAVDRAGNAGGVTLSFRIDTAVFDVDGPYGAWPLAVVSAAVAVLAGSIAFLLVQRRKRVPPLGPGA